MRIAQNLQPVCLTGCGLGPWMIRAEVRRSQASSCLRSDTAKFGANEDKDRKRMYEDVISSHVVSIMMTSSWLRIRDFRG